MGIKLSSCSSDLVQVCDLPLLNGPLSVYPFLCVLHVSDFFFPCLPFESNKLGSRQGYAPQESTKPIWEPVDIRAVGKLLRE